jgi:NAD(P)-dependent dehydrogenase (short-subunit alcohol dehydrogenase family)
MTTPTWTASSQGAREVRKAKWNFKDTVVAITGAAQGQGRSHAEAFARAGADLVLSDLPDGAALPGVSYQLGARSALDEVAEACRGLGSHVLSLTCDVRESEQVQDMVGAAIREFGRIDVLINNAGLAGIREVVDLPEDEWDTLLATNLRGVFLCSKYVAREMIKAGRGKIINTASVNAYVGSPGSAHYVAAKHGVAGFSKALATELAPHGITVTYVCPTAVATPMAGIVTAEHVPADHGERLAAINGSWNILDDAQAPLQPGEVTQAMLFLASDASKFMTGVPLFVDAGFMTK